MNVLVIGSGGREHAICWKIKQSKKVNKLYAAPGNAGIAQIVDELHLDTTFESLLNFCKTNEVDYIIVGPEIPLAQGIVDFFNEEQIPIFGPCKEAAKIESSKIFSKQFMEKYNIPTAQFGSFDNTKDALKYLKECNYPIVIKTDGLAAGKGVIIAENKEVAIQTINDMLSGESFGSAGEKIIIEEFLTGEEASIFAFCDGKNFISTIASQDHKRALDGDKGLNTGGMGAYAPAPIVTSDIKKFSNEKVFKPAIEGMIAEGTPYKGVLYAGLMITPNGPKVLEFNCRFGDPETQVVLSLLKIDFMDVVQAVINGTLDELTVEWHDKAAAVVVLASGGYPEKYEKGKVITGLKETESDDAIVFHAGTKLDDNQSIITSGGRVLGITSTADTLKEALDKCYETAEKINFDKMFYRKDIGHRAL